MGQGAPVFVEGGRLCHGTMASPSLLCVLYLQFSTNKLCAWRHDMPPPLSSPRGRPSASRAAKQTQRSSSFPRPIRSHGHRCTCLTR